MAYNKSIDEFNGLECNLRTFVMGVFQKIDNLNLEIEQLSAKNKKLVVENNLLKNKLIQANMLLSTSKCDNLLPVQNEANPLPTALPLSIVNDAAANDLMDTQKEVEALSSLTIDTQFEADSEVFDENVQERVELKQPGTTSHQVVGYFPPSLPLTRRPILEELFGVPGSEDSKDNPLLENSPVPYTSRQNSLLVPESPTRISTPDTLNRLRFVPETMPQDLNERTPKKERFADFAHSQCSRGEKDDEEGANSIIEHTSPKSQPSLRLTPSEKLFHSKKPKYDRPLSQLISPSKRLGIMDITPKKKSPKRIVNVKQQLRKKHVLDVEVTQNGISKKSQSKLNMDVFKAAYKPTGSSAIGQPSRMSTPTVDNYVFLRPERKLVDGPHSPLNSLENSADMDETNLSTSALSRVAVEFLPGAKENVIQIKRRTDALETKERLLCSYDRYPEVEPYATKSVNTKCRLARSHKIGDSCAQCARVKEYYEEINGKDVNHEQREIDQPNNNLPAIDDTPPGFWNPMITQTPHV